MLQTAWQSVVDASEQGDADKPRRIPRHGNGHQSEVSLRRTAAPPRCQRRALPQSKKVRRVLRSYAEAPLRPVGREPGGTMTFPEWWILGRMRRG